MKVSIKVIAVIFLTFIYLHTNAQKISKLEWQAISAMNQQKYAKALNMYLELDSLSKDPYLYDYMIGMCYLSSDTKLKALPYLESARNSKEVSFVLNYYLGRAYMLTNRYDDALICFEKYAADFADFGNIRLAPRTQITSANRVHMEKSMKHVMGFMSVCQNVKPQNNTEVLVEK